MCEYLTNFILRHLLFCMPSLFHIVFCHAKQNSANNFSLVIWAVHPIISANTKASVDATEQLKPTDS